MIRFHPCCLSLVLFACSPRPQDIGDDGGSDTTSAQDDDASATDVSASASMSSAATADDDDDAGSASAEDAGDPSTESTDGASDGASETSTEDDTTTGASDAALVLFVAFDGATLAEGDDDDSANDISTIHEGNWPAYGVGEKRDAVLEAVQADWSDFAVLVTDERPTDGDYVMVLVGPGQVVPGGLGVAPIDCGDQNPRNIAFVQSSIGDALSVELTAAAISRFAAHTIGLEEVVAGDDLMAANWSVEDPEFTDVCLGRETTMCAAIDVGCPDPNAQNAHAALSAIVGPA